MMLNNKSRIKPIVIINFFIVAIWSPSIILFFLGIRAIDNNIYTTINEIYFVISIISTLLILNKRITCNLNIISRRRKHFDVLYRSRVRKMIDQLTIFSGCFGIIGITILAYDRIFIKIINYSQGVRLARYEWLAYGGMSSIYGIFGNLLIPFSYVSLFWGLFFFEEISRKSKFISLLSGFGVPFTHAYLNGGRMNLLLCFLFFISIGIMRYIKHKPFFPKFVKISSLIIIIIFLFYTLSVFSQSQSELSLDKFTKVQLELLNAYQDTQYNNQFINKSILVISYLYHGKWISGYIMSVDVSERYGFYSYTPIRVILERFNIKLPFQHNFDLLHGAFLNTPGMLYYDFGIFGVLIIPPFLALLFFLLYNRYILFNKNCFIFLFYLLFFLSSPILPFFNIGYVNFVICAFFICHLVIKYYYRIRYVIL